jgi:ribosomal-protein-alanine N-acetyltransferase
MEIFIRKTTLEDHNRLFEFQTDPEANYMAAFTSKNPLDREAYMEKWERLLQDSNTHQQTVIVDGSIVGSVLKYIMFGEAQISYWIDRQYWGKGIATHALQLFLKSETTRPIHGRTATDNIGSMKVLQNCGFQKVGNDRGFANGRSAEIDEYIFVLEAE